MSTRKPMHAIATWATCVVVGAASLVSTGCGEDAPTRGAVRGQLAFVPEEGIDPESDDFVPVSVEGHRIEIDGQELRTTMTDVDGSYIFEDMPPGDYEVIADLQLWSREPHAKVDVTITAGEVTDAETLLLTPAGMVVGDVSIRGGGSPDGFRVQILGTGLAAVADAEGRFVIYRVPAKTVGGYELLAERADIGSARRAGILVEPFNEVYIGEIEVIRGGSGTANTHPAFDATEITFTQNGTVIDDPSLPLPYHLPDGFVRRFDKIALTAPATDPDGDPLTYEWSASAGTLIAPLTSEPRWRPDQYAGSTATLSVTVRDGHGGIARISSDIDILDVFSGSAHRHGERVVHSYRVEGGPWQIDVVWLARFVEDPDDPDSGTWIEDVSWNVIELAATEDPRPLLFDSHVVYRDDGELMRVSLGDFSIASLNATPTTDTPAQPTVCASPPLLWVITVANPGQVTEINVGTGATRNAADCIGSCTKLAADPDGYVTFYGTDTFLFASGTTRTVPPPIGRGISLASSTVAFVTSASGSSTRYGVGLVSAGGGIQHVYDGYYDMIVWSHSGSDVLITEQEYVALRHPPFVRWVRPSGVRGDYPGRNATEGWMADRVYDLTDGTALVRRITRADWPEPFDQSRSEITRARITEAFQ